MGMAPTAGKRVAESRSNLPAGVMGRPSPAGSCWHHALPQKNRPIKRKPLAATCNFICLLPHSLEILLSASFHAALIYMQKSLGKNCFAIFTNHPGLPGAPLGNAFDAKRFYFYDE
jgi:hypothetical protein